MWSDPTRARAAVDCGETDPGNVREEIVVGMPGEESQAAMEARRYAESCLGGGAITIAFLSPQASISS